MALKKIHDVIAPRSMTHRATQTTRKTRDETIKAIAGKPALPIAAPFSRSRTGGTHEENAEYKPISLKRKPFIWIAIAVFIFLAVLLSTFFEEANIRVTPRSKTGHLDKVFVAAQNPTESEIPLRIVSVTDTTVKTIPATHITDVERRAQGKIIVYNDYSTAPQRLVKNTRFETPQGLTYHVRESITVPGQKIVKGQRVPGAAEVVVFAAEAGEKYNIGLTDFTVPGFKGTPRYAKFYGRSKTEMTGGFKGKVKTVPEEELQAVHEELKTTIDRQLREKITAQTAEDFVLFEGAQFIEYPKDNGEPIQPSLEKEVIEVSQTATLYAAFLGKAALTHAISGFIAPEANKADSVIIKNFDTIAFKLLSKEKIDSQTDEKLQFSLKGEPKIVWLFDQKLLETAFAGKPRSQGDEIISSFPGIIKAEVSLRPFWKRSFPRNPEDILVKIEE